MDLEIGIVNEDGLRGTKAIRDMKKDQIAVHLPSQLAVFLGEGKFTPEVCHKMSLESAGACFCKWRHGECSTIKVSTTYLGTKRSG